MISTKIVEAVNDLPTLPTSLYEVNRVANDPYGSTRELAGVIERDQVLTAKVLKLVNSAFYGIPRKITKVEQGITLLGTNAIKNLILASTVLGTLGGSDSVRGLWIHALAVAVGAKVLGQQLYYREVEELFLCGLLHDIGKVVELKSYPGEVEKIQAKCAEDSAFYWETEQAMYGTTHQRIGQLLLMRWKLPEQVCKVVGFHHQPHPGMDYFFETMVVFLADALARKLELGDSWDGNLVPEVSAQQLERIGLDSFDSEEITNAVITESEDVSKIFFEKEEVIHA